MARYVGVQGDRNGVLQKTHSIRVNTNHKSRERPDTPKCTPCGGCAEPLYSGMAHGPFLSVAELLAPSI